MSESLRDDVAKIIGDHLDIVTLNDVNACVEQIVQIIAAKDARIKELEDEVYSRPRPTTFADWGEV